MTKSQDNKLLKIWREKVTIRAKGKCEICSTTTRLNTHHYVGRRNRSTRYYILNGVLLCVKHHTFGKKSAHSDPEWFRTQMLKKRGKAWLDDLNKQKEKIYNPHDYKKILKELENYE